MNFNRMIRYILHLGASFCWINRARQRLPLLLKTGSEGDGVIPSRNLVVVIHVIRAPIRGIPMFVKNITARGVSTNVRCAGEALCARRYFWAIAIR